MAEIKETLLKSRNISHSLSLYAQENQIERDDCDFTLKKVETLVRDVHNKDFSLITKELLTGYLDRDKIIDEHIEFSQLYTLSIYPKTKPQIKLIYIVKKDPFSSEPKVVISPKSFLPIKKISQQEMLLLLYKELNKIKTLNNFLITLFDEEMKKNLKSFIKYLYSGKFTKNLQIVLFSGISPTITREAKLIYWYKEKENDTEVIEVDKDEILIEYKKPIFGKNGLNAYGKSINTTASNNNTDSEINIDTQTIQIEEDDYVKLYKSKQQGFVHFDNKRLSIDNKIKLSTISRNEDLLAAEEDNSIKIIVSQYDSNQDSIGEGVELISQSIHVDGFVGAKSKLESMNLQIDGTIHQDSTQVAKFAKINRHKGKLRCHEAKINLLEGGEVTASKVEVESSIGGTIHAIDVTISHVKSNLKVYASNSITIKLLSGEDNFLNINYQKVPIVTSKLNFLDKDIKYIQEELDEIKQFNPKKAKDLQTKIKKLKAEQEIIKDSCKDAFIHIEKPLHGLNNIVFTIDSNNEIIFKTQATSYEKFHLQIDDEQITLLPVNKSIAIN